MYKLILVFLLILTVSCGSSLAPPEETSQDSIAQVVVEENQEQERLDWIEETQEQVRQQDREEAEQHSQESEEEQEIQQAIEKEQELFDSYKYEGDQQDTESELRDKFTNDPVEEPKILSDGGFWRERNTSGITIYEDIYTLSGSSPQRLLPSDWYHYFLDTRQKVDDLAINVVLNQSYVQGWHNSDNVSDSELQEYARFAQEMIQEHIDFYEYWYPPTGWEDAHITLITGLWYYQDAMYYIEQDAKTGNDGSLYYHDQAQLSIEEGVRYLETGVEEFIPGVADR